MSSEPSPRGAAPAYDEAEKGTLDYPVEKKSLAFPSDEKKDLFTNEKKEVAAFNVPQVKKDPYMAQKGKKQPASKTILFKLWYNTYRCVAASSRVADRAHRIVIAVNCSLLRSRST